MNNSQLPVWLALIGMLIGGTLYVTDIKSDGLVTKERLNAEIQARIDQYDYIKETLKRIEAQTAKD